MQTTWIKAFSPLFILLFCSCSNHDTAEVPEMASAIERASQLPENEIQPAEVLSKHQDLFGTVETESKGSDFAGDPLLGTQGGLDEFSTGSILPDKQENFSQEIDFDAK